MSVTPLARLNRLPWDDLPCSLKDAKVQMEAVWHPDHAFWRMLDRAIRQEVS